MRTEQSQLALKALAFKANWLCSSARFLSESLKNLARSLDVVRHIKGYTH